MPNPDTSNNGNKPHITAPAKPPTSLTNRRPAFWIALTSGSGLVAIASLLSLRADQSLTPGVFALAVLALFLLCLLLLSASRLLIAALLPLFHLVDHWRRQLLAQARERNGRLPKTFIKLFDRDASELAALLTVAAMLIACAQVFLELADSVLEQETLVQFDFAVYAALQALRSPWLDRLMVMTTELGGAAVTLPVVAAVAAALAWQRQWAVMAYWIGAAAAARMSVVVLKLALARDRPGSIYSGVETFSFPSGHATTSLVVYGFLAFLLAKHRSWNLRLLLYSAIAVLVALVGFSRLYLGMHWLSDVAAGYALGMAWITLLGAAFLRFHPAVELRLVPLSTVALLALATAGSYQYLVHFPQTLARYQSVAGQAPAPAPPRNMDAEKNDDDHD